MKACVNNAEHMYSGNEFSPLGIGFSPKNMNPGDLMTGKDENLWYVKSGKKTNVWTKIDFDKLSQNSYKTVFFPQVKLMEKDVEETGIEDKFGGKKPFFMEGETWPTDSSGKEMIFIGQFVNPLSKSKKELIRIFLPIDTDENLFSLYPHVTKINLNKKNLKKQIVIEKREKDNFYSTYFVQKWNKSKELKSLEFFFKKYGFDENKDYEILDNFYNKSLYVPSFNNKVGGTPVFCQRTLNIENKKHLFQFTESGYVPYIMGDSGIGHIYDDLTFEWDCY